MHWTEDFIVYDSTTHSYAAFDETGSVIIGKYPSKDLAVKALNEYADWLERISQDPEITMPVYIKELLTF